VSGFNNQNLSLTLKCERFRLVSGGSDVVIPTIAIEKGTTAALTLEGVEVRFKWGVTEVASKIVSIEVGRLTADSSDESQGPRLVWGRPDTLRPHLYLAPGEKTSFACTGEVPSAALCHVDVVAIGRRRRSSFQAQWRASAVVPSLQGRVD
jgi:hypothetical protein